MWSDNETTEDLLGFDVHAQLISEVVDDTKLLPITIGVFGDWGSGKSSVLKILSEQLSKKDDGTFVLYFNGWLFEGYDDAKAALLESILKEFENNKSLSSEIKGKAGKLLRSVNWMRILGLGFKNIALPAASAYFTGGLSLIPFLAEKFNNLKPEEIAKQLQGDKAEEFLQSLIQDVPEEDRSMLVRDFRENFHELIQASNINKLIVVIDDLDRCTPDRIIENLEAIKLFLNVDKTAFIIGADPRIVRHAIQHRFYDGNTNVEGNNRIVDDYLEKLIQLPYSLPMLSDSEVETYISLLICKRELETDSFEKVLTAFHKFRVKNRYSVFGLLDIKDIVESEYEALTASLGSLPALAPIITQSLYGNPRQIKRFLNTFTLRNRLAKIATFSGYDQAILSKLMILEYTELALFRILYDWQSTQEGKPSQIKDLEELVEQSDPGELKDKLDTGEYSGWAKGKVIKWLLVEPQLRDVDLRDYFWLSRDNISSAMSGVSLIPPIVKSVYQKLNQENLPSAAMSKIIKEDVKVLNDSELSQFLGFVINMLQANQEDIQGYKVFHALVEENVVDSAEAYKRCIKVLNQKKIPPAIGTDLKVFKEHAILGEFLVTSFSSKKSKAAKAFNL